MTGSRSTSRRHSARRAPWLALATALAITACGELGADDRPPPEHSPEAASEQAAAAPAGGAPERSDPGTASTDAFEVKLDGGPLAGTHQGTGDMNCFAQDNLWGATFELQREKGVSGILLMLTGVPARGGSTEQVELTVTFGQMDDMSGNAGMFVIGATAGAGSARATVERSGRGAVIRIEGTTYNGPKISAVVQCRSVDVVT